jgi:hypothetical protein
MSNQAIPEVLRDQLARLDVKRSLFSGLAVPVIESLYGRLRVELTYSSNAIEGNTLSLLDIHQIVMRDIDREWGGRLRNGPVFIKGTRHTPPNAALVGDQLDGLLKWAESSAIHPVSVAAETHYRFESLHPIFRWQWTHRTTAPELATDESGFSHHSDSSRGTLQIPGIIGWRPRRKSPSLATTGGQRGRKKSGFVCGWVTNATSER